MPKNPESREGSTDARLILAVAANQFTGGEVTFRVLSEAVKMFMRVWIVITVASSSVLIEVTGRSRL